MRTPAKAPCPRKSLVSLNFARVYADEKTVSASHNPILAFTCTLSRDHERRRHGRLRTEGLVCSLGTITDLSASGMCVFRQGRRSVSIGDHVTATLKYGQFVLPVDARVVRLEKLGFRRYILGLEFEETNPEIRKQLTRLASFAVARRVLD